ncbi:PREDICTED: ribokinase-like isoform X4 [Lupinus angustifolius]|uniref:ribokinase-like isoform X4 n=1 Tax=Lupinus angustifolius TaxID=3871 RepID=UPI00092E9C8C|nr:PREDICTED: ribokinase-like isoform X4 [Lupinus angustifolius]
MYNIYTFSTPSNFTLFNTQLPSLPYHSNHSKAWRCCTTLRATKSNDSVVVQGGGNVGNALTCVARLGLNPRVISKVANDSQGMSILDELQADGVDTSFLVVSEEGTSPFTYIIVDNQTKTRTGIHTPGYPPMIPDDLSESSLLSALHGARIVYFDGRLYETALVVAQEAVRKNIPILVDAEGPREGLNDLLKVADYVVCSTKFPQAWTEASTIPQALVSILLRLPNIKFVIVTLGKDGCLMLERSVDAVPFTEEVDIDSLVESLEMRKNETVSIPTCISSPVTKLMAKGIGTVSGRLYLGTTESIPPSEVIDTTGAGDAFIGAVLYGSCQVQRFRSKKWSSLSSRPALSVLYAVDFLVMVSLANMSYLQRAI